MQVWSGQICWFTELFLPRAAKIACGVLAAPPPHMGSPEVNHLSLLEQRLELILGLHQLVPEKPLILLLTLLLWNRQTGRTDLLNTCS